MPAGIRGSGHAEGCGSLCGSWCGRTGGPLEQHCQGNCYTPLRQQLRSVRISRTSTPASRSMTSLRSRAATTTRARKSLVSTSRFRWRSPRNRGACGRPFSPREPGRLLHTVLHTLFHDQVAPGYSQVTHPCYVPLWLGMPRPSERQFEVLPQVPSRRRDTLLAC